jgi:alpha-D-ribose 1-methylphosphonate 5-triphosphate synthase subunit PhnH
METANSVRFHRVHDTQYIYRQLLDATAKPGQVRNLRQATAHLQSIEPLCTVTVGIAMTLLDQEVSFHVALREQPTVAEYIRNMTYAKWSETAHADYVFIDGRLADETFDVLATLLKIGTLPSPELSTTVFIKVEQLQAEAKELSVSLRGPGIRSTQPVVVDGLAARWLQLRKLLNGEFPLGIDLVLYTESGDVLGIPRTTIVEEVQ